MKKRIFKYYFILIFLVLVISMFFGNMIAQRYYKAEVENKLTSIAFSLQYLLQEAPTMGLDYDRLANDYADRYNANTNSSGERLRITFVGFTGQVLGDSEADFRDMENHLNRKEIQEAFEGDSGSDIRFSKTVNADFLYVAVPVRQLQVMIRTAVPLVQLTKINDMVRFYSLLTFLVALFLAVLISLKISTSITKPLKDLTLASRDIAKGNYTEKIRVDSSDELGQLAVDFNEMASRLDITIADLNRKRMEVDAIIDSMTNGLVAVDSELKIILINPAACKFFAIDCDTAVLGSNMAYNIRNNQINTTLKDTMRSNKPRECDLTMGNKVLRINTSPIRTNDGGVNSGGIVYIQDITKVRKLEQIRTEFVSNVTHELKTPITSIRGFIETLKNGAISNQKVAGRFLEIIDIEAERLYALIEDILLLSEIESRRKDTDQENLSLTGVVEDAFSVLQPLADENGIKLEYTAKEELFIRANKNRMKQLFLNLLHNGIKYNIPHGSVTVTAYSEKGRIVISVKDTGIGIPAEHVKRIFERFYRVDKGRARDTGGTGLGLSIVKHIVNLYNGDIKVNTEIDKGTEFIIQFPC